LVKQLLEHKADVKTKRTTDHVTALHIALHEQNWDIADILLESGADINAENDEGVTPLHIAVAGTTISQRKLQ
jgi:ankyrin repeat protein